MKQSFLTGLLACLAAVIVWGLQFPVAKEAFAVVDPFHVTLVRYFVALALLLPFVLWREGFRALRYDGHGPLAGSMGAMGMSISPFLVFYGVSITGPEHAAVIVALQPSTMALTQWVVLKRRPAAFTLGSILVAFLGVVMVVTRGGAGIKDSADALLGSVLILGGGLCWVYYTLGTEHIKGWSVWRITALTMLPGAATSMILIGLATTTGLLVSPPPTAYLVVGPELLFLGLFGVLFGMLAWNFGTRRVGPLNSMLLTNLMPVATFTYSALHGRAFESTELVGAGIVLSALIANNVYLRRAQLREAATT
jgi:drug/metabolite transporter (DMT)-like permease